jgi:hypothetical protein
LKILRTFSWNIKPNATIKPKLFAEILVLGKKKMEVVEKTKNKGEKDEIIKKNRKHKEISSETGRKNFKK